MLTACQQKKKDKLNVLFDNVEQLRKGSPVNMRGITIGEVASFDLFKDSVLVEININRGILVPANSKFLIVSKPLQGIASITIVPSLQKQWLKQTDTAKGSYITKGLLDTFFEDSLNRQKAREVIDQITTGLKELAEEKNDSSVN